MHSTLGC